MDESTDPFPDQAPITVGVHTGCAEPDNYASLRQWPGEIYFAWTPDNKVNAAAQLIKNSGVAVYIPKELRIRTRASGVREKYSVRLFDGYLFFFLHDPALLPLRKKLDWQVTDYKCPVDQSTLREHLAQLQDLERCERVVNRSTLIKGAKVEIISGPYRGQVGTIEQVRRMLTVAIDTMGRQTPLVIDPSRVSAA